MIIQFERHASSRLMKRSFEVNIYPEEAFKRAEETIQRGILSCSKRSKYNIVFYKYFNDNLSFFVVCEKRKKGFVVQTVIIKEGRE